MRTGGILLAVLGIFVILGGAAMDTTRTSTTCYEADYSWDYADSSGCVTTTYSNPLPKMSAMMLGFGMLIGGGVLASRADGGGSFLNGLNRDTGTTVDDTRTDTGGNTLVAQIQARQDKEDSNED